MFDYLRQRITTDLPQNLTSAILPIPPLNQQRSSVVDEDQQARTHQKLDSALQARNLSYKDRAYILRYASCTSDLTLNEQPETMFMNLSRIVSHFFSYGFLNASHEDSF